MLEQFIKRENEIFDILNLFLKNKLDFILIGGYAISAFKHRFSVDADIVISSEDLNKFEKILKEEKFEITISKEIKNIYSSKFIRYQKKSELPVFVDLLVDGVAIRQTDAFFSYKLLLNNSIIKRIIGREKETKVRIPIKEFLIILKIHSGRLTDFRDVVALCKEYNINIVKKYLMVGNKNKVKENISKLLPLIDKKEFIDSFKGVFIEKKYDISLHEVKKLKVFL